MAIRTHLLHAAAVLAVGALVLQPSIAAGQSTGTARGKVVDEKGNPMEGVKIVIEYTEGLTRRHEIKTNKKGEFIQVGITPTGNYKVSAEKQGYWAQPLQKRIALGVDTLFNFTMQPGAGPVTDRAEAVKKAGEVKRLFDEGVALTRENKPDEAIDRFRKTIEIMADCADCYYNLGFAYSQKKEYGEAETAFKKAIELRPTYAEAYNGLATVYNAQKKFDEAAAASAKATEMQSGGSTPGAPGGTTGPSARALYNEGVILWNAGKAAEAKEKLEQATKADPSFPEAHFQLGMALVNQNKLPEAAAEFETYLKLAPAGPNAEQAKGMLAAIKK